jgi:hypothetical protein
MKAVSRSLENRWILIFLVLVAAMLFFGSILFIVSRAG